MRFIRLLTAATAVLSVFASPVAQDANPDTKGLSTDTQQGLSATQVCNTINGFTMMSQDLRVRFESVTILNVVLVGGVGLSTQKRRAAGSNFHRRDLLMVCEASSMGSLLQPLSVLFRPICTRFRI